MGDKSRSYDATYLRSYRQANPEKSLQWRINYAVKLLESNGYTVTKVTMTTNTDNTQTTEEKTTERRAAQHAKTLESQKAWRIRNADKLKEYRKRYKQEHPEKILEYQRNWREKHREWLREYSKQWAADHPDSVKNHQRKWREKNPDYEKIRYHRNKEAFEQLQRERKRKIREGNKLMKGDMKK